MVTGFNMVAQVTLSSSPYTENFDGMGTSSGSATLPTGWFVSSNATSAANGTTSSSATQSTWASTTGQFENAASTYPLTSGASTATQNAASNRALAVRSTGSFADPGQAFILKIANTTGLSSFQLSFTAELMSPQGHTTTYRIDYGTGSSPSSFTQVGSTFTDLGINSGAWGTQAVSVNFGTALDNLSSNVWIRVVSIAASSGSGSRCTFGIDDVQLTWTSASTNTITTGIVSPTNFSLSDCAATATATVAFTSTGTFNTGNYYTAWMSDASGSFGAATNVGTLSSTANSGSISITIPAGTSAGTGYLIQIASYSPAVTGSNSGSFTVTTGCTPGTAISGVLSNYSTIQAAHSSAYGCDNSCTETSYTVGPFAHPVVCNSDNVVGCGSCSSVTQSVTFTVTAGCTYTAQAEQKARGASCPDAAMDGGDEIHISGTGGTLVSQYAKLTSPGACSGSGISAGVNNYSSADINTGCGNADGFVQLVYQAPAGAIGQITISYTSDRSDEILTYTFTSGSSACGIIVLPIELMGFYAEQVSEGIKLNWATATETNNNYFMVEYSLDGLNFIPYKEVKGAGNSYSKTEYTCLFTENTFNKTPYFRLKQVDYNGDFKYSSIITLGNFIGSLSASAYSKVTVYYDRDKEAVVAKFKLGYPQQVNAALYSMEGQKVTEINTFYNEGDNELLIDAPDKEGVYFLVFQDGNNTPTHKKIMVSK